MENMEKFKLICKKCNSERIKFKLTIEKNDNDPYALLELQCKNCKIIEEVEESFNGGFTK